MTPYRLARRLAGKIVRAIPFTRRLLLNSCDHRIISREDALKAQARGWHFGSTVIRQERAYQQLLGEMHAGAPRKDLTIAANAVDLVGLPAPSLLEIGCGSGYYVDVFATLCKSQVHYTGLDYSKAMIERAQKRYPDAAFVVGDATRLDMADKAFDVVFNGVSLMHIMEFEKAIAEAARVARKAVIFHGVPVLPHGKTVYLTKYAYGAPVVEVVFNRGELLALFAKHDLRLIQSWHADDYNVGHVTGETSYAETFLCLRG